MHSDPEFISAGSDSVFQLRPLNTGEVFDRIFAVYRKRFAMFLGIALLPAVVGLVSGIVRLLILHVQHLPATVPITQSLPLVLCSLVFGLLSLAATGITLAASTTAISDVYLGEEASIGKSFRVAAAHWFRYAVLSIVQILQAGWLPGVILAVLFTLSIFGAIALGPTIVGLLLVFGMLFLVPYWLYRYAKVSLAMPAAVFEDIKIVASIKRSKALTKERKWRICLLYIVVGVLSLVVVGGVGLFNIAAIRGNAHLMLMQAITLLTVFFANIFLQPINAIGICLFYFDERVRQEGFDIEFMMMRQTQEVPELPVQGALEA